MPTPRAAMAQVAAVLSDVDPEDSRAVSRFYRKQFPTYSIETQEKISGFLVSLTDLASDEDLDKLKRAVAGHERPKPVKETRRHPGI